MFNRKRLLSVLLTGVLCMTCIPVPAYAAEENTPKEEVIYANLESDGSVKDITVVNIFELESKGKIVDFGNYDSVRNMNSTEEIHTSGDEITISAEKGKLYYEGKISKAELPWDVSIDYYMDGKKLSAKEIAGESGKLKIAMQIEENKGCKTSFFDDYALQATVTMDGGKCTNIIAESATIANVGADKQLTYTILPGEGAEIVITADVVEFEMSGIAINGIKLNLNIDVDTEELKSKVDSVIDAVNTLDDGANEINTGTGKLSDATSILSENVGMLHDGVGQLTSGAEELRNGLSEIVKNNQTLLNGGWAAFEGVCKAVGETLNRELEAKGLETVILTPDNYAEVLSGLLEQLDADTIYNQAYKVALAKVTAEVEENAETLYAGYIDSIADTVYFQYLKSQEDTLYAQVAAQAVLEQLIESGYTQEQAAAYLQTEEGKELISQTIAAMSDEQKEQIIEAAVSNLTDDQKAQIKQGAIASLTEEEKEEIRNGYIDQTMKSEEITKQITATVAESNKAAEGIANAKGQLDNFSLFYVGLKDYISAVNEAVTGASTLEKGLNSLYENTGVLKVSVGKLDEAVEKLFSGTSELSKGTNEFSNEVSGMDQEVEKEINSMLDPLAGNDECVSFVSAKNTKIKSVQFVIKTDTIEIEEIVEEIPKQTEELNFWQKLLNLFGV